MRVLVVDDHREVSDFIATALRDIEGLEVDTAASAEAAEAYLEAGLYDLYILDLYLKGGDFSPDGLRFAKELLADHPDSRVILMTGKSYSKIITDVVIRTGSTQLLSKPIRLDDLLKMVRKVLGAEGGSDGVDDTMVAPG